MDVNESSCGIICDMDLFALNDRVVIKIMAGKEDLQFSMDSKPYNKHNIIATKIIQTVII
jgi:hypothetical protein